MSKALFALAAVCMFAAHATEAAPAALDPKVNNGVLPGRYGKLPLWWIPKLPEPAKLSGNITDPVWKSAAHFTLLDTQTAEPLPLATEAWVFCTDAALYLGVRCDEPKLGELQVTTDEIWARDSVELFLEPYKDTIQKPYHQVIVDAAGNFDSHRYHLYQKIPNSAPLGEMNWKPKMEIVAARTDKTWSLEVRIPFTELKLGEEARKKQTLWRMNLYRTRPAKSDNPKSMSWALNPPHVGRYHEPGKFAYILPEAYATKEFIDEVVRTAPVSVPDQPADPADVDKRIAELGSDSYDIRADAVDKLRELFHANPKIAELVESKLKQVVEQSKVVETYAAAKECQGLLKVEIDNQDDPPP